MNEQAKAADESIMLDSEYLKGIEATLIEWSDTVDEGAYCALGNAAAQKILETGEPP